MAILDEIDSGLDIDALRDVATAVVGLRKDDNAVLMITHYQRLLDYIEPTYVHIMVCYISFWHGSICIACFCCTIYARWVVLTGEFCVVAGSWTDRENWRHVISITT